MLDTNIEPVRWAKVSQLRVLSQLLRIVDLGKKNCKPSMLDGIFR